MKIYEIGTGYTSIPARMGAATEIVVEELTISMLKMGVDVTIVDIKDSNRQKNTFNIVESYIPPVLNTTEIKLGIIHKLKRVSYSIFLARTLIKLVKKEKEKVAIHFHNQYNLYFFLKLAPKSVRERVIVGYTVHSYVWFGKWEDIHDTISKRYFQEVYCCQHADRVFVLNDIVTKMLVEHYSVDASKVQKVINGVNTSKYNESAADTEEVDALRNKLGLKGKKIIFQVGSVCDRKNQLGTLKLLLPLMKEDSSIAMAYAGGVVDADYARQIQDFAAQEGVQDRVVYVGEVSPGAELNMLYTMSAATVMNSRSEAFALVMAESLSARRPVFINESIMSSLKFLAEKEGKGIIKITDTFAQDLKELMGNSDYYRTMQDNGRAFIENEYSWDVAAKQYITAFLSMK